MCRLMAQDADIAKAPAGCHGLFSQGAGKNNMRKIVVCYAEGTQDTWEAFCVDFDLAVQGRSFEEVYQKLDKQIGVFLEGVMALAENERAHLLNRKMPLIARVKLFSNVFWPVFSSRSNKLHHAYDVPVNSGPAAA